MLAVAVSLVATASAGTRTQRVAVFFVHGEQLGRTTRPGTRPTDAVRQLSPGRPGTKCTRASAPTSRPARRCAASPSPTGSRPSISASASVAARTRPSLLARLSQLVRTLTAPQAATRVQLLVEGHSVTGVFPGIDTSMPVSWAYLSRPNVPVPEPPPERLKPPDPHVKAAQLRLIALGYLVKGDADGRFGPVTSNALLAFEKWERLPRTGLLDPATDERLTTAARPEPVSAGGSGRRAEILLDRQVTLLIQDDAVMRTIAVSTGSLRRRRRRGTTRSTRRSRSGGRRRFGSGCRWRCRSTAASRSTSTSSSPRTLPRTAASASCRASRTGRMTSPASGCRSR